MNVYNFFQYPNSPNLYIINFFISFVILISTMNQNYEQRRLTGEEDLIVIRHAQSNFNRGHLNYMANNQLSLTWQECIKLDDFNEKVSYATEHIDCHISEQGKQQCLYAKEKLKCQNIDIVLVSPQQRALETCRQIFGDRQILVEVHPIFAEVFRFSCDISRHIEQKMKEFSNYNFSHMKDHSQLWFIQILSDKNRRSCQDHLNKETLTFHQKQQKILQLVKEKVIYESASQLRERIWKIKQLLKEYKKKYNKIAIVAHFHVVQTLIATEYDEESDVVNTFLNTLHINNAHPIELSISQLLKIK